MSRARFAISTQRIEEKGSKCKIGPRSGRGGGKQHNLIVGREENEDSRGMPKSLETQSAAVREALQSFCTRPWMGSMVAVRTWPKIKPQAKPDGIGDVSKDPPPAGIYSKNHIQGRGRSGSGKNNFKHVAGQKGRRERAATSVQVTS